LIDEQGLETLTMRKLAQELGVDPMSLYRHFANKDALLDGLTEVLWAEVALPEDLPGEDMGWQETLRTVAGALHALAHAHPHAYALVLSPRIFPLAALRLWDAVMERLQQAGFARERAAAACCTVCGYALGAAMVELSALAPDAAVCAADAAAERADIQRFAEIMRRLPRETPPRLVEVACVLTNCDMDAQFRFGLDLMLAGLMSKA
jgi:AcrR family transcriptional regulator